MVFFLPSSDEMVDAGIFAQLHKYSHIYVNGDILTDFDIATSCFPILSLENNRKDLFFFRNEKY